MIMNNNNIPIFQTDDVTLNAYPVSNINSKNYEGIQNSRLQLRILLEIQPFKLSVWYGVVALATKMLTIEASYLRVIHWQRSETCYTD